MEAKREAENRQTERLTLAAVPADRPRQNNGRLPLPGAARGQAARKDGQAARRVTCRRKSDWEGPTIWLVEWNISNERENTYCLFLEIRRRQAPKYKQLKTST